ncbi:cytochrome b/b6 domain-containing protein [Sphingomonas sp. MMSM20]|uniref:cytochrome b/b6 domain-containing protein n=1 Tax=Sphingomonas lycopersici TaxID=2951807 RepID=UPI002238276E|nr:cytochrome b/b6 domain-containing protein [Sphingomonas lycopersici]
MTATKFDEQRPRRWDAVVRLTHWSVVAAVVTNAIFAEGGSRAHVWVGYALAAILALRLLWGLVGPTEARFSAFPPSPRRALTHIREILAGDHRQFPSHNPLGALMVYAIWSCLGIMIASGIAMAGFADGPAAGPSHRNSANLKIERTAVAAGDRKERDEEREDGPLSELHEITANILYVLIALHLAGVLFETRRSGRQIVVAMLPGRR